jgi:hypothetical protein
MWCVLAVKSIQQPRIEFYFALCQADFIEGGNTCRWKAMQQISYSITQSSMYIAQMSGFSSAVDFLQIVAQVFRHELTLTY